MEKTLLENTQELQNATKAIVSTLQTKTDIPTGTPLSKIAPYIEILDDGSGAKITVHAIGYDGEQITCSLGENTYSETVADEQVEFIVDVEGIWTITTEDGKSVEVEVKFISESELKKNQILGVRIKQSESDPQKRVEPIEELVGLKPVTIDQSTGEVDYGDMKDTWLFNKFKPCMVRFDGTIDYYLDPEDETKRLDNGERSDVDNIGYEGNAMVKVDKMYYKAYNLDGYEYMMLSPIPRDEFEPIAWKREDDSEMDYVFQAMYKGCYDSSGRLRSISGQKIRNNTRVIDFVSAAQKNGTNYNIEYHSLITVLDLIYLILFQNDNSQVTARGRDYNGGGTTSEKEMSISTGFANTKGPIAYDTASQGIKMMHIEDHWGNNLSLCMNGMAFQNDKTYIKMQPPYSSTSVSEYTEIPNIGVLTGYISTSIANTNYGRIPNSVNSSDSTYQCDRFNSSTGTNGIFYMCARSYSGVWYRTANATTNNNYNLGASLTCLQPK